MPSSRPLRAALVAALALGALPAAAQTGTPTAPAVRPGAPGQPSQTVAAEAPARRAPSDADVRFVQGMLPHHAQALEMTALVPSRTTHPGLRALAERVEASQADEIASMQRWLEAHGAPVPGPHAHHTSHANMPGMLTAAQMAALAGASGVAFDRLFLEGMIRHHEGAVTMVQDLFGSPGGAQGSDLFRFAADVDADQRGEIRRMQALLATLPPAPPAAAGAAPRPHH